jgi:hypothetical protein
MEWERSYGGEAPLTQIPRPLLRSLFDDLVSRELKAYSAESRTGRDRDEAPFQRPASSLVTPEASTGVCAVGGIARAKGNRTPLVQQAPQPIRNESVGQTDELDHQNGKKGHKSDELRSQADGRPVRCVAFTAISDGYHARSELASAVPESRSASKVNVNGSLQDGKSKGTGRGTGVCHMNTRASQAKARRAHSDAVVGETVHTAQESNGRSFESTGEHASIKSTRRLPCKQSGDVRRRPRSTTSKVKRQEQRQLRSQRRVQLAMGPKEQSAERSKALSSDKIGVGHTLSLPGPASAWDIFQNELLLARAAQRAQSSVEAVEFTIRDVSRQWGLLTPSQRAVYESRAQLNCRLLSESPDTAPENAERETFCTQLNDERGDILSEITYPKDSELGGVERLTNDGTNERFNSAVFGRSAENSHLHDDEDGATDADAGFFSRRPKLSRSPERLRAGSDSEPKLAPKALGNSVSTSCRMNDRRRLPRPLHCDRRRKMDWDVLFPTEIADTPAKLFTPDAFAPSEQKEVAFGGQMNA